MSRSPLMAAAALLALAGCAGPLPTDPATAGNHPGNPDAPATPMPPPSQTLAILDPSNAPPPPPDGHAHVGPGGSGEGLVPLPGESGSGGMEGMNMKGMKGMDHGSGGGMKGMKGMEGMDRDATPPGRTPEAAPPADAPTTAPATRASAYYTCPMHPEVHADAPGRCPICGMKLVKAGGEGGGE